MEAAMTRLFFSLALAGVLASPSIASAQGAGPMTLTSTSFANGAVIPIQYTQAAPGAAPGEGMSPALSWANPPQATVSFLVHMHDLQVARNRGTEDQLHWLVWNIPASSRSRGLPEGMGRGSPLPDGTQQTSPTGPVYRGPGAPANGPLHHYVIEVYALDTMVTVTPDTDPFVTRARVLEAVQGHVLGKAVHLGMFKRPQ
jgi:Raf kinase inhibitor-like YbhB/YbcL family protein